MGLRKRRKADLVRMAFARNELYKGMYRADYIWIAQHRKNLINHARIQDLAWIRRLK